MEDSAGVNVKYEAPLSTYNYKAEPRYPSNLEPDAYVFDGWYTNPFFAEGTKVDWETAKMPASAYVLYAHWVPKNHNVNVYLTEDMTEGVKLGDTQIVAHGSTATAPDESSIVHPGSDQYKFVGWFYRDEQGNEKAFDFSMPVNRDLNLYAKWSSDVLMEYVIHYELADGTEIAEDTTGSGLAGTTKTFEAKVGDKLYIKYQEGYYPQTASHSLTFDITGENEYTFVYVQKDKVPYIVKYLEVGTEKVLYTEKKESSSHAVITEEFVPITGYRPDAYQKRLVLSADEPENVLIFWYVKDGMHAPVHVVHMVQNIVGDGYTEYSSSTKLDAAIDYQYFEDIKTIPGFGFARATADGTAVQAADGKVFGTVDADGLELILYYDRLEYPYEFRFLEQSTDKQLAEPITETARYGAQATENAKTIAGYTLVSNSPQAINIAIEAGETAFKNVATFYYAENEATINYRVVGPTGCGTVDPTTEVVKVITGTAQGSIPTANAGYRFVGWYKDEACTQSVDVSWVDTDDKLTPQKDTDDMYKATTYYAKFEVALFDLTINKTVTGTVDNTQTFIFKITGSPLDTSLADVDMTVTIQGNGSTTIKDLPVGNYTVTEDTNWSWRYSLISSGLNQKCLTDTTVAFTNKYTKDKWLSWEDFNDNTFNK